MRATRTFAGLLGTYREVRRPNLEDASYLITHIVEPLTHQIAAHPEDPAIVDESFQVELVAMLEAYLTAGPEVRPRGSSRAPRARTSKRRNP